jgi:hypothetical protein
MTRKDYESKFYWWSVKLNITGVAFLFVGIACIAASNLSEIYHLGGRVNTFFMVLGFSLCGFAMMFHDRHRGF